MSSKRILVLSDLHCGHRSGLTPPTYQSKANGKRGQWNKFATLQSELWQWYTSTIRTIGPVDLVIVNGDCIDGEGSRSGGTELIVRDRIEQAEMAKEAISVPKTGDYAFTYGTPYHTGCSEDMEDLVAKEFKAKIGSHEFIKIGGKVLDIKHHCTSSSMPYGDLHQIGRQIIENGYWASRSEQPFADLVIRSHVHKFSQCTIRRGNSLAGGVITPALQGYGSKYGARKCSRPVDVGMLLITIQNGEIVVHPYFASLDSLRAS